MNTLIESLTGTCVPLGSMLDQLFDLDESALNDDNHSQLDGELFECEDCGWWCERNEESDVYPDVCVDCYDLR